MEIRKQWFRVHESIILRAGEGTETPPVQHFVHMFPMCSSEPLFLVFCRFGFQRGPRRRPTKDPRTTLSVTFYCVAQSSLSPAPVQPGPILSSPVYLLEFSRHNKQKRRPKRFGVLPLGHISFSSFFFFFRAQDPGLAPNLPIVCTFSVIIFYTIFSFLCNPGLRGVSIPQPVQYQMHDRGVELTFIRRLILLAQVAILRGGREVQVARQVGSHNTRRGRAVQVATTSTGVHSHEIK